MRRTETAAAPVVGLAVGLAVGFSQLALTPLPAMAQKVGQESGQEGGNDGAFAVPDCAALLSWATGLDRKQSYHLTPVAKIQNVFEPERSKRVFGIPAVHWTAEQAGELVVAKKSCAQGSQKAKRPADTRALNAVNVRVLQKSLKAIATHRETVAQLIDALGAGPAGPELQQTVAAMTPPRYRPGPALKQVADAESRKRVQTLARSLAQIPEDEASAALGAFAGEQASLAQDLSTAETLPTGGRDPET